jgi:hypothetical protein
MNMLPKWKIIFSIVIITVLNTFLLANIQLQVSYVAPMKNNDFNIIFKYGVGEVNELNTFNNSFTKDMRLDPSITIWLHLSDKEMNQIKQKMVEINFFSLPENMPPRPDGCFVTPQTDFYIRAQNGSTIKEVSWCTNSEENSIEQNLMQLANLITGIVEQRPEYRELPPPNAGYC